MNYKYNISKECPSCGITFIANLLDEEDICHDCCNISLDSFESSEDDQLEIEMLINPYGSSRTKPCYYD